MKATSVTWLDLVPSVISLYLGSNVFPASVKHIGLTGECLSLPLALHVLSKSALPPGGLQNAYGPAEAFISTQYEFGLLDDRGLHEASVAIGRPCAFRTAFVLGSAMELLPAGAPGEIHLGGHGLARGYLNNPDATARSFVPNPFGAGRSLNATVPTQPSPCSPCLGSTRRGTVAGGGLMATWSFLAACATGR